jgi:hypothetical protein
MLLVTASEVWNLPAPPEANDSAERLGGEPVARYCKTVLTDHWHDPESVEARADDSIERLGGEPLGAGVPVICGKRVEQLRTSGGSEPCPECLRELNRRGLTVAINQGRVLGVFDMRTLGAPMAVLHDMVQVDIDKEVIGGQEDQESDGR